MHRYRAIFLDAGFTIITIYPSWEGYVRRAAQTCGLSLSTEQINAARKAGEVYFRAHYYQPNDTWTNDQAIHAFWKEYYRVALESQGLTGRQAVDCAEILCQGMNQPDLWRPFPEVLETLAGLRRAGYIVGVLSDWSSSLPYILESLGLCSELDFLVVSAIEGVAKPRPSFFQRALDRAQVRADQAVMVGDSLYADVQGAAQVGIKGILIDRFGRHSDAEVSTISQLGELWPHLE